jgi:heme-degrading monooxygenase HmoA
MTPSAPYFVAVITTELAPDVEGYDEAAVRMESLVNGYAGFLGVESVRDGSGRGISVSYWRDLADLQAWRRDVEHRATMRRGQERWYQRYHVRVARVEREYRWDESEGLGLHGDEADRSG